MSQIERRNVEQRLQEHDIPFKYSSAYENPALRGIEEPRPWNIEAEIVQLLTSSMRVLDIGCGTGTKLVPVAGRVAEIWGVEPSESMRARAIENFKIAGVSNFHVVDGVAEKLPFPDNHFDFLTCMVAPHSTGEVHRVLRPGGIALIEKIGDLDKKNFKDIFGADEKGERGYLSGFKAEERELLYDKEFRSLFRQVAIRSGQWKTYYSREGLEALLSQAKTVRDFDPIKDANYLNQIVERFSTAQGIETTQHRILIIAKEPKK